MSATISDYQAARIAGEWRYTELPGYTQLWERGAVLPDLAQEIRQDLARIGVADYTDDEVAELCALLLYALHHVGRGSVLGWADLTREPAVDDDFDNDDA